MPPPISFAYGVNHAIENLVSVLHIYHSSIYQIIDIQWPPSVETKKYLKKKNANWASGKIKQCETPADAKSVKGNWSRT